MTSKNSFWKFSLWNFKQRAWSLVIIICGWFFLLPGIVFVKGEHIGTNADVIRKEIIADTIMGGDTNAYFYGLLCIAIGIFLALTAFSYNNHQNKTDLYLSVPVKALHRFLYINANSLLIFIIGFGGNMALANVAAAIRGIWNGRFFQFSCLSFVIYFSIFAGSYALALIAQHLTGNPILGFLGSGILFLAEPLCNFLSDSLMIHFYDHHVVTYTNLYMNGVLSPFTQFAKVNMALTYYADAIGDYYYPLIIKAILILFLEAVIYGFIAYKLYLKKTGGNGGKAIAFSQAKPVIKVLIMVLGALTVATAFTDINGDKALSYGLLGAIFALLFLQLILQLIMEGNFKDVLKGRLSFLTAAILTLGIYFGIALDVTGYDTYLPDIDKMASISLYRSTDMRLGWDQLYPSSRMTGSEYLLSTMCLEDEAAKQYILSVLSEAIQNPSTEAEGGELLLVRYFLNNGKEVNRSYMVDKELIRSLYAYLYDLPEYIESVEMVLQEGVDKKFIDPDNRPEVSYLTFLGQEYIHSQSTTSVEVIQRLLGAQKEDTRNRKAAVIMEEAPIGIIYFNTHTTLGDEGYGHLYLPVYESDENIIAILKEIGWYQETGIDPGQVSQIDVYETMVWTGENAKLLMTIEPDDSLFEPVLSDLFNSNAKLYMSDPGMVVEERYEVEVYYKNGSVKSCMLLLDGFPEELREALQ
ncbi:MAG: hypothetical protein J1E61_03445 [Lachnospiraceae bacterium]|nr:hypothetical protein [Lachnospiraceae bacterium]